MIDFLSDYSLICLCIAVQKRHGKEAVRTTQRYFASEEVFVSVTNNSQSHALGYYTHNAKKYLHNVSNLICKHKHESIKKAFKAV